MLQVRSEISLLKVKGSKSSLLDILDGFPPEGFLGLLGLFVDTDSGLTGPEALRHVDFEITDPESLFTMLGDFYEAIKSDPAAFAAVMAMPAIQADVFKQLKDISDAAKAQKTMRMDGIQHQFEIQREMHRQAQRDVQRSREKRMEAPAPQPKEEPKRSEREREALRREKAQPENNGAEELDDMLEAAEAGQDMDSDLDYTADELSGPDFLDLALVNPQEDKEEKPAIQKEVAPPEPAVAWDRPKSQFNEVSKEVRPNYPSHVVSPVFEKAASFETPHFKRRDNMPTYDDQLTIKLNQELNLGMSSKPQQVPGMSMNNFAN